MMSRPDSLALIALLAPAAVAVLLGVVAPLRRNGRLAALMSIAGALTAFVAAFMAVHAMQDQPGPVTQVWTWLPQRDGALATIGVLADGQSTLMLVLVSLVASLVQIYSLGYLSDEPPAALGRYYLYQSLFAFSMMGLVLAPNFVQLFVCWELVGLCSYLLIGFWYKKASAARAAVKAFWTTKLGDVGLLIGIVLLWRMTGTFDFSELEVWTETQQIGVAGIALVTFCIYLGAAGKSAQFPLHIWLPDAMEGPTPVSALIHAATMVTAGVYLLFRVEFLFALAPDVLAIVAWVGAVTALMAAILACAQDDIKRVLAYSTVSQLGFMMAAIGAGFASAGFLHLLTHGVFKALLFLGAGAVIHAVGTNDIRQMGGLARKMPQTAIVFIVGTLSLAGVPFFAGFLSKEEILGAVLAGGFNVPLALLFVAAFLTSFYMFRVVFLTFFTGPEGPASESRLRAEGRLGAGHSEAGSLDPAHPAHAAHAHHAHDAPAIISMPLWFLALLSVAIGAYFVVEPPFSALAHPGWLMVVAVGVSLGGIALAWLAYQRRAISAESLAAATGPLRAAAANGFWIDHAFELAYRGVLLAFSRTIGWVDRYFVDGLVNVMSAWTVMGGGRLRRMQTGRVQDYVFGVSVGLVALLIWLGGAK